MGVDPGQHFVVLERFGQVVDTAGLEPLDLGGSLGQGSHKDNRDVPGGGEGFQLPTGLEAIDARHHHVHQDQVRSCQLSLPYRTLPIKGGKGPVAGALQGVEQELDVGRLVVHHQDGGPVVPSAFICYHISSPGWFS